MREVNSCTATDSRMGESPAAMFGVESKRVTTICDLQILTVWLTKPWLSIATLKITSLQMLALSLNLSQSYKTGTKLILTFLAGGSNG